MYETSITKQAVVQEVTVVGTSMGASTIWSYIELFGEERIARAVFVDQAPLQVHIWLGLHTICQLPFDGLVDDQVDPQNRKMLMHTCQRA